MQMDLCYVGKQEYKCYIVWRDPGGVCGKRVSAGTLLYCGARSWMISFRGSTVMVNTQ
jgi:hypothetical protein